MNDRLNQKQNAGRDTGGAASGGYTAEQLGRESGYDDATTFAKRMRLGNQLIANRKKRVRVETKIKNRTIPSLAILGLVSAVCGLVCRAISARCQRETDTLVDKLNHEAANGETVSFRISSRVDVRPERELMSAPSETGSPQNPSRVSRCAT
jgi:hypothetical protein